jgi:hypothetical protein
VPAAPAPTREYKIGDTGPAGGLIFYDKGNNSSGWRYMEAAPPEIEFRTVWGSTYGNLGGTSPGVGSGKENTRFIMQKLQDAGSATAAHACGASATDITKRRTKERSLRRGSVCLLGIILERPFAASVKVTIFNPFVRLPKFLSHRALTFAGRYNTLFPIGRLSN